MSSDRAMRGGVVARLPQTISGSLSTRPIRFAMLFAGSAEG